METFNLKPLANMITGETAVSMALFLLLLLWTITWKGYALWTAAGRKETKWFIALLILNTFALLEIFYLLKVAKKKDEIVAFFKAKILRLK